MSHFAEMLIKINIDKNFLDLETKTHLQSNLSYELGVKPTLQRVEMTPRDEIMSIVEGTDLRKKESFIDQLTYKKDVVIG